MNLRTSCFNSAVFRSDVKRFWWVPVLHTLAIALLCLLPIYMDYHDFLITIGGTNDTYTGSVLFSHSPVPYIILIFVTVGLSALLFSYLNAKSAVATLHTVPVKRKTLYITHTVFGIIALLIPILLSGGILMMMRANPSIAQMISANHIGAWVSTQIAYAVVGFAFSVLIGMFTGNSAAHLVLSYIFALLPLFVELALRYMAQLNFYGFSNTTELFVLKYVYFTTNKLVEPTYFLIYIAYALIFLIAGCLVYKCRNLENSSEVVAFPKLKPIFVYGVSICFGVAGYLYLTAIINVNSLFFVLPFGLLGLIIANMLTKKAFTLKGIVKPTVALAISLFALFGLFRFDITGFQRRMPDATDIASVSVTRRMPGQNSYYGSVNGRQIVKKDVYVPNLTQPEDIKNVLAFHENKIENPTDEEECTDYLYIHYTLKNGKTMTRYYGVNYDTDKNVLRPIMETEENKQDRFPILAENAAEYITSVSIEDTRLPSAFNIYFTEKNSDTEMINRLIAALKADLEQVTYEEFIYEGSTPTSISLQYNIPLVYEGTDTPVTDISSDGTVSESYTYYIRPSYQNTMALLTELGFYDALPKATDYQTIDVYHLPFYDAVQPNNTVTDPAQIEEIYQYVTTHQPSTAVYRTQPDGSVITLTFQSNTFQEFSVTWSNDDPNMPPSLANLFS